MNSETLARRRLPGQVHRFRFKDVDLPGDGATGAYGAFRVMRFRQMPDGKRIAGWVSSDEPLRGWRCVGCGRVLAARQAYSVLAYGQTTNPGSNTAATRSVCLRSTSTSHLVQRGGIKANLESEYRP
jgi:hypothetical protein